MAKKKVRPRRGAPRGKRPGAALIGIAVLLVIAGLGVGAKLLGAGGGEAPPREEPGGLLVVMEFSDFG